ncbi:thioredoxin domain-containing protein [Cellulomonas sp.]|uniref:thioredoxin domain-containing protein n=1 Tax=Cellulomonas sp. TaxID=40001 RepID=UPI001AFD28D5|nr:thioredoxin domain-containing protein [Cellulomonas sp.]MBO9555016.1 thioredoxin domain-containing protein [Cellulomonas sp.]
MPNRLAAATSPYLQQHADNPVDWHEWGDAAFEEAARRDVPVLVSVGYAACHWCHVMAHESFEDEAVAALMNEHFVCVKVDREERPDVDAVYMAATQATTGSGGWPMTVFTTPLGEPFFCGTYYPPRRVQQMPAFTEVLAAISAAWTGRRDEVVASAAALVQALAQTPEVGPAAGPGYEDVTGLALTRLATTFDEARGGFGGAPKFPPTTALEWLLRRHARSGDASALTMADRTIEAMVRGGMYDQLGGGFARYSVDATWTVPHFEKMLDDNAGLLRVLLHAWRLTGSDLARRAAGETADWLVRDLRTSQGGFASSLDADSDGHEGTYYVWTPDELRAELGADEGDWAASALAVTVAGTFEHGRSVLQRRSDPADHARLDAALARLRTARARRTPPARDDKVVTGWNGLAIAALAEAGALLDRPDLTAAAVGTADLLLTVHTRRADDGSARLVRASRDGTAGTAPGLLEDYAHTADGYLALAAVTGDHRWTTTAGDLLDTVLTRFAAADGGFEDTADDETDAVVARVGRPRARTDGPAPNGQSAAAGALLTFSALTGSLRHREAAERALRGPLTVATTYPRAAGAALAVVEALLDGPREVAVVGPADDPRTDDLHRTALRATAPGLVVARGTPIPDRDAPALLHDRPLVDGRPAAYVCRGFVCDLPTTSPDDLERQLARTG